MVTLLSLLCLVCVLVFAAALVLLVIRTVKKKPRKPFVIMAAASCVLFMVLCVAVSSVYEPREKPAPAPSVSEPVPASQQPSEESEKPEQREPESTEPSAPVDSQTPSVEPSAPTEPTESEPPAETETENPEQPSAPDGQPSSENPLYAAETKTGDVMSGIGGSKIGEYAWIEMPKSAMLALSQEEMVSYAKDVISAGKGSYNWFTIAMDDGTGLVFHNCFYPVFSYGVLDADGSLSETLGSGLLLDESVGYEYSPAEGNP